MSLVIVVIIVVIAFRISIFSEVEVQALPQPSRKLVLEILSVLLAKYPSKLLSFHYLPNNTLTFSVGVKDMKSDFVVGFVHAVEREKDPRNLLLMFKLFVTVVKGTLHYRHSTLWAVCNPHCGAEFPDFARFTEELVEIVTAYYPITFTPKANDPDKITKQDLENALLYVNCITCNHLEFWYGYYFSDCFTASVEFAPYLIPFLLDKLDTTAADAKVIIIAFYHWQ